MVLDEPESVKPSAVHADKVPVVVTLHSVELLFDVMMGFDVPGE